MTDATGSRFHDDREPTSRDVSVEVGVPRQHARCPGAAARRLETGILAVPKTLPVSHPLRLGLNSGGWLFVEIRRGLREPAGVQASAHRRQAEAWTPTIPLLRVFVLLLRRGDSQGSRASPGLGDYKRPRNVLLLTGKSPGELSAPPPEQASFFRVHFLTEGKRL